MERRKTIWRWFGLAALVAVMLVAAAACGGDDEEAVAPPPAAEPAPAPEPAPTPEPAPAEPPPAAPGLGSAFDVASAGDVTLNLWWLGDLEAPGAETWMEDMVAKFEGKYPNVKIETTLEDTNTWVQTQQTACQSKSGPDLWYNWAGTWSLELAWKGCTVPNEEILSPDDIAANPFVQETVWQGKTWDFPFYRFVYPVVVNLDLIKKAGLDPNALPTTWSDWTAALQKLKDAGITPLALGLKDGFDAEIVSAGQLEKQWMSSPDDLKQMVIDGNFETDPRWKAWLDKLFELKPYFNADANSVTFAEALGLWQNGKTAMVFGSPGVQATIADAEKAGLNVGLMKMPAFGDGAWADSLVNTSQGFQVTQWSEHKEVAGAFMAFIQEPDNLAAFYEATGNFPVSTNWDPSQVTSATDTTMLGWLNEKSTAWWAANYTPVDFDVNGRFVVFQKMMAGEIDEKGAAKIYQDTIEKWRKANPDGLQNFKSWLGS